MLFQAIKVIFSTCLHIQHSPHFFISWNYFISKKLPGIDQDFPEFGKFPSKWKHRCYKPENYMAAHHVNVNKIIYFHPLSYFLHCQVIKSFIMKFMLYINFFVFLNSISTFHLSINYMTEISQLCTSIIIL